MDAAHPTRANLRCYLALDGPGGRSIVAPDRYFTKEFVLSDTSLSTRPGRNLDYPLGETRPELGTTIEIAPGIHWIRMRLPMQLNHINLWLLEDGAAGTSVDTGIRDQTTTDAWKTLFAGVMGGKPVKRVIVTHLHPD